MTGHARRIVGWLAVAASTIVACVWGFWGGIENFHEGWFYESLLMNLAMMVAQYLLPMLGFMAFALAGVRWPRLGSLLHVAAAAALLWFFRGRGNVSTVVVPLLAGPLLLLAAGYWYGRPEPRRRALAVIAILPLATAIVSGVEPAARAATRVDDGYQGVRRIAVNGVDLVWAPAGPGWPRIGVSWDEAVRRCRFLAADGRSLADTPQNIWRLPEVDEAVRSQARHGANSGGAWDGATATYRITPDKESPLWDIHSQVIYWWTATEVNERQAYIIVYDGKVWPRQKRVRWGYLGFRAVKPAAGFGRVDVQHAGVAPDMTGVWAGVAQIFVSWIPMNWVDDHFEGGVNTSGWHVGGKEKMWLAAPVAYASNASARWKDRNRRPRIACGIPSHQSLVTGFP